MSRTTCPRSARCSAEATTTSGTTTCRTPIATRWVKYGVSAPKQLKAFGANAAPSRFAAWKREFDGFVKAGKMPSLQLIRFCTDHTAGTSVGLFAPSAMVADNDYAVGQLVDAVSHSAFWKSTAIIIVEDDAQAGYDHIDAYRSIVQVISPYVPRATVDHRFYNTDSALRTIGLLQGMTPMNQYDAAPRPLGSSASRPPTWPRTWRFCLRRRSSARSTRPRLTALQIARRW